MSVVPKVTQCFVTFQWCNWETRDACIHRTRSQKCDLFATSLLMKNETGDILYTMEKYFQCQTYTVYRQTQCMYRTCRFVEKYC